MDGALANSRLVCTIFLAVLIALCTVLSEDNSRMTVGEPLLPHLVLEF